MPKPEPAKAKAAAPPPAPPAPPPPAALDKPAAKRKAAAAAAAAPAPKKVKAEGADKTDKAAKKTTAVASAGAAQKSHVNLTRVFADFKYRKAITVANPARLRVVKGKLQAIDASQVKDPEEITQMLIADGVHELDKGDPKGYFWDDYYKDWKISIRWQGKRINFGHIKSSEALAKEAGAALVEKKKNVQKGADFKTIGKTLYATFKARDVQAPKDSKEGKSS